MGVWKRKTEDQRPIRLKNNLGVERDQRLLSLVFVFQTPIIEFGKRRPKIEDTDLVLRLSHF